ncbi:cleavage stimulating factor 64-like [Bidens hawaiensis]|uniref:cleavage stimulating factor 64-like n=1 Tax=Bidens hawaiensis TaxID=980011 RepID=UPI00404B2529
MADGVSSMNLAGMSKNQLYDIMSQMKTLIEQNQDQARQILIQNPPLTKALFQAQIMLGMLHPPQEAPKSQPDGPPHPPQATPPAQQPVQNPPLPAQQPASLPTPLLPLQPVQHNRTHTNAPLAPPMLSPQSSNMAPQYSTQPPPSVIQPTLPPVTTPLQPPMHISSTSHLPLQPPLQPPLPPQPRPASMPPTFPHQSYPHMGPGAGFQHQGASQLHHSQPVFHSASRPPTSMSTPFSQGQPPLPNQQPPQTLYQGGSSHVGMDFNQMGIQPERGSNWMPEGPSPTPFLPPHMSSASQPPRPASLTADMEKALLQQVMSLTPEQINMLPPDQRNQVLQLQKMLRQ